MTDEAMAALCLTCGTPVYDPTAGACHGCGAEDKWVGSQWLRPGFPADVMPFALSTPAGLDVKALQNALRNPEVQHFLRYGAFWHAATAIRELVAGTGRTEP